MKIKCNNCGEDFYLILNMWGREIKKVKVKCYKCNEMIEVKFNK